MSFFDLKKVDQKSAANRRTESDKLSEEARRQNEKALKERRWHEESAILSGFVNEAFDEFPSMALRAGTRTVRKTLFRDHCPRFMWPSYDVWELPGRSVRAFPVYSETNRSSYHICIDTSGKILSDIEMFRTGGYSGEYLHEVPRQEAIKDIVNYIIDRYYHARRKASDYRIQFLDVPPITRELARELVEQYFMEQL